MFIFCVNKCERITPAYAGNTKIGEQILIVGKDHPRLRGEHHSNQFIEDFNLGSPPPTRGTLYYFVDVNKMVGITPAYAGNTSVS